MSTQEAKTEPAGGASVLTDGLGGTFRAMSDNAYCAYIQQMRREVCLGWEHKVQTGKFGHDNLDGFMRAAEWLGRHKAMAEAERMANDLQAKIDALMLEYCPDEMTEAQRERWARHQQRRDAQLRGNRRCAGKGRQMNQEPLPAQGPVDVNVRPLAWRRVSNICGEVRGVFETQEVELRSERLEPLFGVKAIECAAHDAVVRALDEAGVRDAVLRGMCIEVAIEKLRDMLRPNLQGEGPSAASCGRSLSTGGLGTAAPPAPTSDLGEKP